MAPPPAEHPTRVLYIAYWGAVEPLGQALIVPAVRRLAELGPRLTLVTFEKPADAANREEMERVRALLEEAEVRWLPLDYHKRPKVPATGFDFAHGVARAIAERIRDRPEVIHARTFIGGLIGLAVSRLTRAALIYHAEGFYSDEQVDAGFWAEGSLPHRIGRRLEKRLYTRADAVFSTSKGGKAIIESLDGVKSSGTPVIVVPSCVDLDHFSKPSGDGDRDSALRLVYVGSVGGRYLVDRIGRFASVARQQRPGSRLELLTGAEPGLVRATLDSSGLPADAWTSRFVPYRRLPGELAHNDAGLCFHSHGLSAPGGSSTKVGEYWAMGLPVISTPGLGDVDDIIREEGVGVMVRDLTDDAYREAFDELLRLLDDPQLSARCRDAAERHYGLDEACERQVAIYERLEREGRGLR
ncbi:MAG: glycosyltransferase [Solirubrobacterales bacterium]